MVHLNSFPFIEIKALRIGLYLPLINFLTLFSFHKDISISSLTSLSHRLLSNNDQSAVTAKYKKSIASFNIIANDFFVMKLSRPCYHFRICVFVLLPSINSPYSMSKTLWPLKCTSVTETRMIWFFTTLKTFWFVKCLLLDTVTTISLTVLMVYSKIHVQKCILIIYYII